MLTVATIGMAVYGFYSGLAALVELFGTRLELWASLSQLGLALLLLLAAPLVRVRIPGGLPLAAGAMLGLQALALHAAAHAQPPTGPIAQGVRAALAASLLLAGIIGGRRGHPPR